jgi:hypothetical protein
MSDVDILLSVAQITLGLVAKEFLAAGNREGALGCLRAWQGLEVAKGYPRAELTEEELANLDLAHQMGAQDLTPGQPAFLDCLALLRRIALTATTAGTVPDTADTRELLGGIAWRQALIEKKLGSKADPTAWIVAPAVA